jgi:hypothetical protein
MFEDNSLVCEAEIAARRLGANPEPRRLNQSKAPFASDAKTINTTAWGTRISNENVITVGGERRTVNNPMLGSIGGIYNFPISATEIASAAVPVDFPLFIAPIRTVALMDQRFNGEFRNFAARNPSTEELPFAQLLGNRIQGDGVVIQGIPDPVLEELALFWHRNVEIVRRYTAEQVRDVLRRRTVRAADFPDREVECSICLNTVAEGNPDDLIFVPPCCNSFHHRECEDPLTVERLELDGACANCRQDILARL